MLGGYLRSYFTVNLNFGEELSTVEAISDTLMPTFFHEYFHFVQDLTTPYGLHSTWARLNQLQQMIQAVQYDSPSFRIPYTGSAMENVKKQVELLNVLHSDIGISGVDPNALSYEKLTLELRPQMRAFEHVPQTRFVKLHYRTEIGEPCSFWFGGAAVAESMTDIIQENFLGDTNSRRFPYKIAKELASTIDFDLFSSNEMAFALCDLALLSNNPGFNFYSIAVNVGNRFKSMPKAAEFYEAGLAYLAENGYNLKKIVTDYRDKVIANVSQLFGHEAFRNERGWLMHIVEAGAKLRIDNPYFMLESFEQTLPVFLRNSILLLGTPEIRNFNYQRYFTPPAALMDKKESIFPFHLSALFQMNSDFMNGTERCSLLEYCRLQNGIPVNDLCYNSHWNKVTEQTVCPLTALYKSFGLAEKLVTT